VACADKVVDDVGGRRVSTAGAEPFVADGTLNNAGDTVDPAVSRQVNLSDGLEQAFDAVAYAQA
jgi:hypothetical protein